jgi:hypothetical protein
MNVQSAWGMTLGDLGDKSWAEDAMDEEAEHGQIAVLSISLLVSWPCSSRPNVQPACRTLSDHHVLM